MKELTCIICPEGCSLSVEEGENLKVTGNNCARGIAYAQEEIREPKRTVTATCAAIFDNNLEKSLYAPRRVPVKTSAPCHKEKIAALLETIYKTKITLPVKMGQVIIADWNGSGIDIVATRSLG